MTQRPRLIGRWSALVVAQATTLVAALLPVMFHLRGPLVELVFVTAISTVAVGLVTIAAQARVPPIHVVIEAAIGIRASATVCLVSCGAALITGFSLMPFFSWAAPVVQVAMLTASQGVQNITLADAVRRQDRRAVAEIRLSYAVALFVLTVVSCVYLPTSWGLVLATCVAGVPSAAIAVPRTLRSISRAAWADATLGRQWQFVRSNAFFAVAALFGQISTALAGLVGPAVGEAAYVWAASARVGGGFQTVGKTVVGVPVDISFVRALRALAAQGKRSDLAHPARAAAALAAVASVALITLGLALHADFPEEPAASVILGAAVVLYWAPQVAYSVVGRLLGMLETPRAQLALDATRATAGLAALVLLHGLGLLSALAVISTGSVIAYGLLLRRAWRLRLLAGVWHE